MQNGTVLPLSAGIRNTALALAVDAVTAEVVTALRDAGIRPLLLKGPSIAGWLYGEGAARPYGDSDLLVSPGSYGPAENALRALGFRPLGYLSQGHVDSQAWLRRSDNASVDLHRSLVGVCASPDVLWEELAAKTETLRVGGIDVEVLGMPGRALHIALHAAQHGVDSERPLTDLGRAIRIVDEQVWREATELARRVDALPAFATGLRLDDPAGRRLVEHLHLPVDRPPLVVLRAGPEVRVAITLERLASEGSLRARARLLLGALLPSPGYMRKWATGRGWPWVGAGPPGRLGLWLAYIWRLIWILVRLPRAVATVRRARRGQGSAAS
jgi:Uncharacterised nucleotidyltransferase